MKRLAITIGVIAAAIIAGGQTIQPTGGGGGGSGTVGSCATTNAVAIYGSATSTSVGCGTASAEFFLGGNNKLDYNISNAGNWTIGGASGLMPGANGNGSLGQGGLAWNAGNINTVTMITPVHTGIPPTNSGSCAVTSQVGGNTAGTWVASGACTAGTYVLTFAATAPNGWDCAADDRTTAADFTKVNQTASTVTGVTFTATTASADVVGFHCAAY